MTTYWEELVPPLTAYFTGARHWIACHISPPDLQLRMTKNQYFLNTKFIPYTFTFHLTHNFLSFFPQIKRKMEWKAPIMTSKSEKLSSMQFVYKPRSRVHNVLLCTRPKMAMMSFRTMLDEGLGTPLTLWRHELVLQGLLIRVVFVWRCDFLSRLSCWYSYIFLAVWWPNILFYFSDSCTCFFSV